MNAVVATARIFEKVPIPRSDRTSKVLRFTPGNVIPGDVAERLNVGADGTQSSIPTADAEATSAVPLTPTPTKAAQKAAPAKKVAKAKSAAKTTKKASKAAKKG